MDKKQTINSLMEDKKQLEIDLAWEKEKRKNAEEEREIALQKVKDLETMLSELTRGKGK
jgi:hypothetical protein